MDSITELCILGTHTYHRFGGLHCVLYEYVHTVECK